MHKEAVDFTNHSPMTPSELERIGISMFGRWGWPVRLGKLINKDPSTIRRWRLGQTEISLENAAELRTLSTADTLTDGRVANSVYYDEKKEAEGKSAEKARPRNDDELCGHQINEILHRLSLGVAPSQVAEDLGFDLEVFSDALNKLSCNEKRAEQIRDGLSNTAVQATQRALLQIRLLAREALDQHRSDMPCEVVKKLEAVDTISDALRNIQGLIAEGSMFSSGRIVIDLELAQQALRKDNAKDEKGVESRM